MPARMVLGVLILAVTTLISSALYAQGDAEPASHTELSALLQTESTPRPPTLKSVEDAPNDAGGAIEITWELSPDDNALVSTYVVMRAEDAGGHPGEFTTVGDESAGNNSSIDGNTQDGVVYYYKVAAVRYIDDSGRQLEVRSESAISTPVRSSAQWFHFGRSNTLIAMLIAGLLIIWYIERARSGRELFIRKIAGLDAVDEAVGRATEMGRKIFYIPGTQDMNNVQTIAGISILGRVAELAAQYETWLQVPVSRSLVLVTAREVVKEAYAKAGRPDAFKEEQVHYLTDDQFGYAAGIDGMVVRERPATIFYQGAFYGESLILAETGASIGAIQIAGTAMPSQLPFFIAACDYTLIGEELFAASAYLSREPRQLGSLKGQDLAKGIILVALFVGIILETLGIWNASQLFTVN